MSAPIRSTDGDVQASWDATFDASGTAINNTFNAGTNSNRFLLVTVTWDGASSHTMPDAGVTYNGVTMTALGATVTNGSTRVRSYGLIAPATGSNTLSVDPSTGVGTEDAVIAAWCYSNVNQSTAYENYNTANGSDASAPLTSDVTITSSATDRLVWASHAARGTSIASGVATGFTERVDNVNVNVGVVGGEATGAASVVTSVTWTGPASITWGAMGVSLIGIAAGPTIDTQPTAQTAVVNNDSRNPVTFTVAATTSGGTLVYDWELETSVGGGVYANLSDGSGATWTGQAAASCTGTFTLTTLSGRRVRCNVSDDNGTTTTNAVTLTILTGPVLSSYSGTTDGSGVVAVNLTSDDALTTNGEVLRITAEADGLFWRVIVRPT